MAIFTDSGAGGNFLGLAFETRLLFPDLVLVTATDTEVVLHNLHRQSFTILTGTGLATETGQLSAEGLVTAFEIRSQNGNDSTMVFAATGIS